MIANKTTTNFTGPIDDALAFEFSEAIRTLPAVPVIEILKLLAPAAMGGKIPGAYEAGKRLQKEHGFDAIPPRTEYECAAGLWDLIRRCVIEHRDEIHHRH